MRRLTNEEFIKRAQIIHDDLYDYSKVEYKLSRSNVLIVCSRHGEFSQRPNDHLSGNGCPKCGKLSRWKGKKVTRAEFIERADAIHDNRYDYSYVEFENTNSKIKIVCPEHGEFEQVLYSHLEGKGCRRCYACSSSKMEQEWLDSLNIRIRQKILKIDGKLFKPDGYDPKTNTVYEFFGDYWHGNPSKYNPENINPHNKKTFGELYEATILKIRMYQESGYNIEYIWESDYTSEG